MFLNAFSFFTKAFSMLANHVLSNMKIRKGEQRRDALLARLNVDTDQLLGEEKKQNKNWYYTVKVIGHFRVAFCLCVETCLREKMCLTSKERRVLQKDSF